MTQSAIQELEQKTLLYQQKLNPEQWNDADFLLEEADKLETQDLALAHRILQRVKILKPDDKRIIKREKSLNKKVRIYHPELMSSSSRELSISEKIQTHTDRSIKKLKESKLLPQYLRSPFGLLVILPVFCLAFYLIIWASPRYESQTQLIVKQPDSMSTLDPTLALMAGFGGGGGGGSDTELVKAYIYSNDMYLYLKEKIALDKHYSAKQFDVFSRLSDSASLEDQLAYYKKHLKVEIDSKSSIVGIYAQAYSAEFALTLTRTIVERSEWYINEIGHRLAKEQLNFVQNEHKLVEQKLQQKKAELLAFQRRYNLLNPEAEGLALQQITYELEGKIATKKAELRTLMGSMSAGAPQVLQVKEQLDSLNMQLQDERKRLTRTLPVTTQLNGDDVNTEHPSTQLNLGVNEVMSRFTDYKMNMEFALQAYSASQISLEKSRIEAYRQLKFLMVVETPTLAEDAKYPRVLYNIVLLATLLLLIYGIGKIILATIKELR